MAKLSIMSLVESMEMATSSMEPIGVVKMLVVKVIHCYQADMQVVRIRKQQAKDELIVAQNVLSTIDAEVNYENAIQRVLGHLESAFTIFIDLNDVENSYMVGMYKSVLHKILGSGQPVFMRIWKNVPIAYNYSTFGEYDNYVKKFFTEIEYENLVNERKDKALKAIDAYLQDIKIYLACSFFAPGIQQGVLRGMKIQLVRQKNNLLKKKSDDFDVNTLWEIVKPW